MEIDLDSSSLFTPQGVSCLLIVLNCGRTLEAVPLADSAIAFSSECNFDIEVNLCLLVLCCLLEVAI